MFCVNCGKQIADGSAFCDQCGAPQAAPTPAAQPAPQPVAAPATPMAKLTKKFTIPNLIALIAAVVLLLTIFLPYMAANKEYAEMLDEYGSEVAFPGSDITAKDLKDVSLVEFAGIAEAMADFAPSGSGLDAIPVLVYAIAILGFVAALFAYFKKPVLVIIPSALAYGIALIFEAGIKESGALNMSVYDWGIAHTLIPLAVLGCIVGAVWMIVEKNKAKKAQATFVYPQQ